MSEYYEEYDKANTLWCKFQNALPFDNSMGDYNYLIAEFLIKKGLEKEFLEWLDIKTQAELSLSLDDDI